jgi:hypothetical protein
MFETGRMVLKYRRWYPVFLERPQHSLSSFCPASFAFMQNSTPVLGQPSPFVAGCANAFREAGHRISFTKVPYEFQRGGNEMMRITRPISSS